jgi:hypothetical protein
MTVSHTKHYLTYWKTASLEAALLQREPITAIWSKQFGRINAGDTIWIAGPLLTRFICLGGITVKRVVNKDETWTVQAETPLHPRIVDLTDDWKQLLTFESSTSLSTKNRSIPDGKQLQTLRVLSRPSTLWLTSLFKTQ